MPNKIVDKLSVRTELYCRYDTQTGVTNDHLMQVLDQTSIPINFGGSFGWNMSAHHLATLFNFRFQHLNRRENL